MTGLSLELPAEQSGVAGKERILAMMIDYALAFFAALLATKIPSSIGIKGQLFVAAFLAYFLLFEWLATTPGKAMFGLRVETIHGERCTFSGALIRTLFRIIEVNPVLLGPIPGGFAIMRSSRKQRWGDRFGGVVVVRKRRAG